MQNHSMIKGNPIWYYNFLWGKDIKNNIAIITIKICSVFEKIKENTPATLLFLISEVPD